MDIWELRSRVTCIKK